MRFFFLFVLLFTTAAASAQHINWQNKDLSSDAVFGISTEKAYALLLKHRKAKSVLVAVIDGGVDTAHEDLKPVIWINPGEVPDGLDNDQDGYVDDVHGWNFIGGPGGDLRYENIELTRLLRKESRYDSLPAAEQPANYRRMKDEYNKQLAQARAMVHGVGRFKNVLDSMLMKMAKKNPVAADFKNYKAQGAREERVKEIAYRQLRQNPDFSAFTKDLDNTLDHFQTELDYHLNMDYQPRPVVGDQVDDSLQKNYGNADVTGPDAHHGTHVSGIIAAVRNNGMGIDGIADHVQIMSLRVVPDGDERDKDVANGIRFAADHGARIINMSFGKGYSPQKPVVDDAVRYAMDKDVLIVHGAGNDGKDLDSIDNFPNRRYADGGVAGAWIEVGASGEKNDSGLVADFSNYGNTRVDVFAPGVQIYSTTPGSQYDSYSGTSMASPVVAGLAALIREYYPRLKATQVKDIILRSVSRVDHFVYIRDGNGGKVAVPFADLCVSGGVVNAYNALLMARKYKRKRQPPHPPVQ